MAFSPYSFAPAGGALGVNLNATGDTSIPITLSKYIITALWISNFSASPAALFACSLRDAAAGAGNSLMATTMVALPSTAALDFFTTNMNGIALATIRRNTASTLFFNVGVANGSTLTADVFVFALGRP